MQTFQEQAKAQVTDLIKGKGLETAKSLSAAFAEQFGAHPNLSSVAAAYASQSCCTTENAESNAAF